MVLTAEKRRMLAEGASKRKAGAGPSVADALAPVYDPPAATFVPSPSAPAPVGQRKKGVVEATASKDKDTCTGLVYKRQRVANAVVPAHSASDDCAPSFRENPPSASSPWDIVMHEGEGKSAPTDALGAPPAADLPTFLQQALHSFQERGLAESLGEDPLQGRATKGLGEFLVASSLAMTKV